MTITIIIYLVAPFIISLVAYWVYLLLNREASIEEPIQAPDPLVIEKEFAKEEAVYAVDLAELKTESSEKQPPQTVDSPSLPYSIYGIISCLISILFWIMIGLSAIAHDALQPKVKNFLFDPISYTLERIFLAFFQPFVELAKAGIIASGAGMLISLILGIVGLLESGTDKTTAILGCILSVFGLMPALSMIF